MINCILICHIIIHLRSYFKYFVGFLINRLQYALLSECWRLVAEGYADAKDIDDVVKHGLGLRYAFSGLEIRLL